MIFVLNVFEMNCQIVGKRMVVELDLELISKSGMQTRIVGEYSAVG